MCIWNFKEKNRREEKFMKFLAVRNFNMKRKHQSCIWGVLKQITKIIILTISNKNVSST